MSVSYLKSLLFKSALIQKEIEEEQKRRIPDTLRLLRLKKIRLALKDRMVSLMGRSNTPAMRNSKQLISNV